MIVPVDQIRADIQAQPRAAINTEIVEQYAGEMGDGATFPPIIVFHDGKTYWIADGFHRFYAASNLGLAVMDCDVREGGLRDAILFSCSANASHGLRRTNEDKRRAVMRLLDDMEWSMWSDREIGRRCGVSHDFASRMRGSLSLNDSEPRTFTTKHGTVSTMNTAAIGKPKQEGSISERAMAKIPNKKPPIAVAPDPNEGAWIAILLEDLVKAARALPAPCDAAARIPAKIAYSVRTAEIADLARTLLDFCDAWEARGKAAA